MSEDEEKVDPLIERMASANNAVEEAEKAYLKARGWNYTSSTPGSVWLWVRTLPVAPERMRGHRHPNRTPTDLPAWSGVTVMMATSDAIYCQRALDGYGL